MSGGYSDLNIVSITTKMFIFAMERITNKKTKIQTFKSFYVEYKVSGGYSNLNIVSITTKMKAIVQMVEIIITRCKGSDILATEEMGGWQNFSFRRGGWQVKEFICSLTFQQQ